MSDATQVVQLAGAPADIINAIAAARGITTAEAIEVLIEAHAAPDGPASVFMDEPTGTPLTADDYKTRLTRITDERVSGIRLGAVDTHGAQEEPFTRDHSGVDMGETDLATLWRSIRGHWVISATTSYLVPFRAGQPLGNTIFYVHRWSKAHPDSKRRWAKIGYAIVGDQRVDPETGTVAGPADDEEKALVAAIAGTRLAMKDGARNPVVVLR